MANKKTKLLRYAKTPQGWRRGNAIVGKTGKVRPDCMIFKGREICCPEGYFIVRTYVGKLPKYKDVGNDGVEALAACKREQDLIDLQRKLRHHGYDFPQQAEKAKRKALHELRDGFLEEKSLEPHRSEDAMSNYRIVVKDFVKSCGKTFPDQLEGTDILRYCRKLEESGNTDRTRANRFGTLCTFLRYCKLAPEHLLTKAQIRKLNSYVESEVETYTPQDLAALLSVSKPREALLWGFLYYTGLRFLEAAFLEWTDIDFNRKTLSVRKKVTGYFPWNKKLAFIPKDSEERTITVVEWVIEQLKAWHDAHPNSRFIFITRSRRPMFKMLVALKACARRAGLNCGKCGSCVATKGKSCQHVFLHKFRATCLSNLLENGYGLRSVMKFAGHSSIESTERYLRPASGEEEQSKVNRALSAVRPGVANHGSTCDSDQLSRALSEALANVSGINADILKKAIADAIASVS